MKGQIESARGGLRRARVKPAPWVLLCALSALLLGLTGCREWFDPPDTISLRQRHFRCRAVVVDLVTRQPVTVISGNPGPGVEPRIFFDGDWDGNGVEDEADVLVDWQRYLVHRLLPGSHFADRSWCVIPSEVSCERTRIALRGSERRRTAALPPGAPAACAGPPPPRLEISAPTGAIPADRYSFPDTAVGAASPPVTLTVTNRGGEPLRLSGVDFSIGADVPDFVKTADNCRPRPDELSAGRGRLMAPGEACTAEFAFRPQHRDGVPECGSATGESCRRLATVFATGFSEPDRRSFPPARLELSGRAPGGRLVVVEPAGGEVCFSASVPVIGWCTERRTIRVRNDGLGELAVSSAGILGGSGAGGFQQVAPTPALTPLAPGGTADFTVRFCNEGSSADGAFVINSSDPLRPTTVVTLVNPLRLRCP